MTDFIFPLVIGLMVPSAGGLAFLAYKNPYHAFRIILVSFFIMGAAFLTTTKYYEGAEYGLKYSLVKIKDNPMKPEIIIDTINGVPQFDKDFMFKKAYLQAQSDSVENAINLEISGLNSEVRKWNSLYLFGVLILIANGLLANYFRDEKSPINNSGKKKRK